MERKQGISLIVLVVMIIIMIIIAGAVIISLNNTNVIDMGEQAVQKHNEQSIEEAINVAYQDLLIKNLGKISGLEFKEKLEDLSKTYTEIQNITSGNGKVFYSLSITGKEYQLSTSTGKITEYVDQYEKVIGEKSLWVRSGTTIKGFNGTGDELQNVIVPNVLPDENGNEIKITNVSLNNIDFEGTLTISNDLIINKHSFVGCTNLKEIVVGNNVSFEVTYPQIGTFTDCTNLEKVTMGTNIKFSNGQYLHLGSQYRLFYNCPNLKDIIVDSIDQVVAYTFSNVSSALKGEIVINEGVTEIGSEAFKNCSNITSISLPSTLTKIGGEAFRGSVNVKNMVNLPENLITIGEYSFEGCPGIKGEVEIKDNTELGKGAFNSCENITKLKIGQNVNIQITSFMDCTGLKEVTIGDGVAFTSVVHCRGAFNGCTNLEKVTMGKNIKFNSDGGADVAFANCPNIKTVTIESISGNVTNWTFKNVAEALQGEVVINEGATLVGYGSFWDCKNITSVTIPSTITKFTGTPFKNCTGLQNVKVNMTEEEFTPLIKSTGLSNDVEIIYLKTATE